MVAGLREVLGLVGLMVVGRDGLGVVSFTVVGLCVGFWEVVGLFVGWVMGLVGLGVVGRWVCLWVVLVGL